MIIMKAVSDIVKIVEDYLNVSLHEDTIAYSRFVIHLKFLFKTVLSKQNVPEVAGMDFIFTQIKSEYKNVIECVKKIADYIMEKNLITDVQTGTAFILCYMLYDYMKLH